jgi:hypothetical protein
MQTGAQEVGEALVLYLAAFCSRYSLAVPTPTINRGDGSGAGSPAAPPPLVKDITIATTQEPPRPVVVGGYSTSSPETTPAEGALAHRWHPGSATLIRTWPGHLAVPAWAHRPGGALFFVANDGSNGNELWRSDGTPAPRG